MKYVLALLSVLLFAVPILAATEDEINEVAERMYCPICENEPLDDCRASTCIQWKAEIGRQLDAGRTPDEIIAYFVDNYGQHVVGVPRNPGLRALSFAAPIIGTILAIIVGFLTFRRWQQAAATTPHAEPAPTTDPTKHDTYRSQLERDLLT